MVARVFEAPSRAFLREHGPPGCGLAMDLGCGPGFTTRLLQEVLGCQRVVGVDASTHFAGVAARTAPSGVEFLCHDVRALPFPGAPADLLYARLLVSHLAEAAVAIRGFVSQLRPGGRLLLDEVEWIRSESPVCGRYLRIVEQMLAARGQCLYVGPRLGALCRGLRVRASELRVHPVAPREAGAMFSQNLAQFRHNEEVTQRLSEPEVAALAADLAALRDAGGPPITWGLRQLVIEA